MNQIIVVVKSILTTNQISMNEFKDAFIAGKAKLVTLNTSGNFVTLNTFAPFLFINYNGENYNTNISLEASDKYSKRTFIGCFYSLEEWRFCCGRSTTGE